MWDGMESFFDEKVMSPPFISLGGPFPPTFFLSLREEDVQDGERDDLLRLVTMAGFPNQAKNSLHQFFLRAPGVRILKWAPPGWTK